MEQREPAELHCDIDQISNLPALVIDEILSRMPIRDAVRTSVLSKNWSNKWDSIPHLVFNDECVSHIPSQDKISKFVNIVDHVLLLHNGPIRKFKLTHEEVLDARDIDRWILHVSKKSIKGLILDIWTGKRYKVPNSLFACQSLVLLELYNCLMKPLSSFKGFKNLESLGLVGIIISQDVFENLTTSCPILECLWLASIDGFNHLNIDAPNLKFVYIDGVFDDVKFKNTFRLAEVSINQTLDRGSSGELLNFFVNLPNIKALTIDGYFLKYLAIDNVPNSLPHSSCTDLSYLSVQMNFDDLNEGSVVLCS